MLTKMVWRGWRNDGNTKIGRADIIDTCFQVWGFDFKFRAGEAYWWSDINAAFILSIYNNRHLNVARNIAILNSKKFHNDIGWFNYYRDREEWSEKQIRFFTTHYPHFEYAKLYPAIKANLKLIDL